jgi:hydrogenase maturation protease
MNDDSNTPFTLVLACGNTLRGDDGIGPRVASRIDSWQVPRVCVHSMHQLTPECIELLSQSERVLFVDAGIDLHATPFECLKIAPKKTQRCFGHFETAANLLALALELYGHAPDAWMVTIAGTAFDHGEGLTKAAEENVQAALAWIRDFLLAAEVDVRSRVERGISLRS